MQELTEETPHLQHTPGQDSNKTSNVDPLSKLYSKAAKKQDMDFQDYCKQMRTLNAKQWHIVMYNRAWCNSKWRKVSRLQNLRKWSWRNWKELCSMPHPKGHGLLVKSNYSSR